MSRLEHINEDDLDHDHKHLLARPINLFRVIGNSPGALRVHHEFGEWVRWQCTLDGRLRELIILLVGIMKRSDYEFSHHVEISRQFGVTDDDIENLFRFLDGAETPYTPAERAALTMTQELTAKGSIPDQVWDGATGHFTPEHLTDIVTIAAFYSYVCLVLEGLHIEVEPDYQKYLHQFPFREE